MDLLKSFYYFLTHNFWGILSFIIAILTAVASISRFYFKIDSYEVLANIISEKLNNLFAAYKEKRKKVSEYILLVVKAIFDVIFNLKSKFKFNKQFIIITFITSIFIIVCISAYEFYIFKKSNEFYKILILKDFEPESRKTEILYDYNLLKDYLDNLLIKSHFKYKIEIQDYNPKLEFNKYNLIVSTIKNIELVLNLQIDNSSKITIIDLVQRNKDYSNFFGKNRQYFNLRFLPEKQVIQDKLIKIFPLSAYVYISIAGYNSNIDNIGIKSFTISYVNYHEVLYDFLNKYDNIIVDAFPHEKFLSNFCNTKVKNKRIVSLNPYDINFVPKCNGIELIVPTVFQDTNSVNTYFKYIKFEKQKSNYSLYNDYVIQDYLKQIFSKVSYFGIYELNVKKIINEKFVTKIGLSKLDSNFHDTNHDLSFYNLSKLEFMK